MPPADLEIWAHVLSVSKMPSIESSFIWTRKHDDIWGVGVPALKRVGLEEGGERTREKQETRRDSDKLARRSSCLQAPASMWELTQPACFWLCAVLVEGVRTYNLRLHSIRRTWRA